MVSAVRIVATCDVGLGVSCAFCMAHDFVCEPFAIEQVEMQDAYGSDGEQLKMLDKAMCRQTTCESSDWRAGVLVVPQLPAWLSRENTETCYCQEAHGENGCAKTGCSRCEASADCWSEL